MRALPPLLALGLGLATLACTKSGSAGPADVSLSTIHDRTTAKAKVGDQLEVTLSSPRGVAPEYRFDWSPQPSIDGDAVRFVSFEIPEPPRDHDGGSFAYVYRFEAASAGSATITVTTQNSGEEAEKDPWTIRIDVHE